MSAPFEFAFFNDNDEPPENQDCAKIADVENDVNPPEDTAAIKLLDVLKVVAEIQTRLARCEARFELVIELNLYKAVVFPDETREAETVPLEADVVRGSYEGGLKLWEGAVDLVRYMREMADSERDTAPCLSARGACWRGQRVVEFGCGHALPALFAAIDGASAICVHDFNAFALQLAAGPNFVRNLSQTQLDALLPALSMVSGSWRALPAYFASAVGRRVRVVLAAETMYDLAQVRDFARCVLSAIDFDQPARCGCCFGVALIAAKRYYFGVGGGVAAFERELSTLFKQLQHEKQIRRDVALLIERVRSISNGASNIRDVLRVVFRAV